MIYIENYVLMKVNTTILHEDQSGEKSIFKSLLLGNQLRKAMNRLNLLYTAERRGIIYEIQIIVNLEFFLHQNIIIIVFLGTFFITCWKYIL